MNNDTKYINVDALQIKKAFEVISYGLRIGKNSYETDWHKYIHLSVRRGKNSDFVLAVGAFVLGNIDNLVEIEVPVETNFQSGEFNFAVFGKHMKDDFHNFKKDDILRLEIDSETGNIWGFVNSDKKFIWRHSEEASYAWHPERYSSSDSKTEGDILTFSDDGFLRPMHEVSYAVSDDDTRYYLNGIFVHGGERLTMVATNGHILSTSPLETLDAVDTENTFLGEEPKERDSTGVIVPRDVVSWMLNFRKKRDKIFSNKNKDYGNIDFYTHHTDKERFLLEGNFWRISFRKIDAIYADYKRIFSGIKEDGTSFCSLRFKRSELLDAVKNLKRKSSKNTGIGLIFYPKDEHNMILSLLPKWGNMEEDSVYIDTISYKGKVDDGVEFNVDYIISILNHGDSDELSFEFHNSKKSEWNCNPTFIKDCSDEGDWFSINDLDGGKRRQIIMPIRLNRSYIAIIKKKAIEMENSSTKITLE